METPLFCSGSAHIRIPESLTTAESVADTFMVYRRDCGDPLYVYNSKYGIF